MLKCRINAKFQLPLNFPINNSESATVEHHKGININSSKSDILFIDSFDFTMFAKLFQKPTQSQSPPPSSQLDGTSRRSMTSADLAPRVAVHYGIPSTASVLAFDPIQRLLAVGTLDGRIKVIGGDNIEVLLISPKALPFKNLEFLQNQGFLVSVSNENEIQVWDLEKRCLSSNLQWESSITAFSLIIGTNYMYVGDEYGFLSVLKYDNEEGNIVQLPYHVPPNLIAEAAGITLPDQQSIVGVLSHPRSCGNRVLIAYENGLIILWDVTEDRAVHIKGYKDLELKEAMTVNVSDNQSQTSVNDSLDNEEAEKEISSLCWASSDGSVLAVGYVDGDIFLWNLSVSNNGKDQKTQKSPDDVVKIQLSSGDRRLPVIVLHWSSNKSRNGCGGQLFAYGGAEIGSEEVLTILDLDWSSGLTKLKCVNRVDLTLHGSFADIIIIPNARNKVDNSPETSLFVLTNPGQLHFYDYASLSILKSDGVKNHSVHSSQYNSVIPTVEPYMTVGKQYVIGSEGNYFGALPQTVSPAKQQSENMRSTKWPLTGGVPYQMSTTESNNIIERIYIGGYQDGTVRIFDATFPVLNLVAVLGFEIKGIQVDGTSGSISALDLCSASLTLAVGNEFGCIFLYSLQGNTHQTVTVVTETKNEVLHCVPEERNHCSAIFSISPSPVCALQFATSGVRLVVGFQSGQVAVLDTRSPSVLFVSDYVSSSRSPVISLAVKTFPDTHENSVKKPDSQTESESAKEISFVLTRDAHMTLMDSTTGNVISAQPMHSNEKIIAVNMYLLDDSNMSSQHIEDEDMQPPNVDNKTVASRILLCCEEALYVYPLKSLIQGDYNFVRELKLEKPCAWTTIFKRDAEKFGVILVYQTGEIEIRSFPELEPLGKTSMMSILRWNFKNNMDKTMSASDKGQITVVNGCEFSFVSLLAFENEFRIPETLPSLHDQVLAAAADADVHFSQNQKKEQSGVPGFVSNVIKGLKGVKEEQGIEARESVTAHLERIYSRFPFSDPYNLNDLEDLVLQIDDIDIDIDEPVPLVSSSQTISDDIKGKGTQREKLFEGGTVDTKPTTRTREEIIAKYRKTGDAAGAASQAKEKLMERKEKLEKLSLRTEELQNGAENYASMATELAKAMEKRKWWNI